MHLGTRPLGTPGVLWHWNVESCYVPHTSSRQPGLRKIISARLLSKDPNPYLSRAEDMGVFGKFPQQEIWQLCTLGVFDGKKHVPLVRINHILVEDWYDGEYGNWMNRDIGRCNSTFVLYELTNFCAWWRILTRRWKLKDERWKMKDGGIKEVLV